MIFRETKLPGVFVIEMVEHSDERGGFARTWCKQEFASHGLNSDIAQCSASFNRRKGTLRGMHYQVVPDQEVKVVRCIAGAIYDVVVDLRTDSPTYTKWAATELSAANHLLLYIPEGLAHGYQTLEDNTEVTYQISAFYEPRSARGVRWNDPVFNIEWPIADHIISPRDAAFPDFIR
jgi:dTDP-4-dehydrorhamnose 3,5-epimerase